MPVQTLRGTRSFPHGRGPLPRRPLLARRRAGAGQHGRGRPAGLRGRAGPRLTTRCSRASRSACTSSRATASACSPPAPGGVANPVWVDDDGLRPRLARAPRRAAGARRPRSSPSSSARSSRAGWTARARCGSSPSSRASPAGASRCCPRCTTRSSTASRRSTSAPCCSTRRPSRSTSRRPTGAWEPQAYDRARHLARLAATPIVRAQKLLLDSANRALRATDPRRAAGDLRKATELLTELARTRPQAPMTPLNRRIGPNRRYAIARAPLAELKAAAKAHGGTVNDAILALVAGMLRRYLERPATPSRRRRSRSCRSASAARARRAATASRPCSSTCRSTSPTRRADRGGPRHDARAQGLGRRARRRAARRRERLGAAARLLDARPRDGRRARVQPRRVQRARARSSRSTSTARGCSRPIPVVPLNPASQGLTVGVLSYDGGVHFGLLADRDLDPAARARCEPRSRKRCTACLPRPSAGNGPLARPARPQRTREVGSWDLGDVEPRSSRRWSRSACWWPGG